MGILPFLSPYNVGAEGYTHLVPLTLLSLGAEWEGRWGKEFPPTPRRFACSAETGHC